VHNVGGAQIAIRFPGYGCLEQGMKRTYVRPAALQQHRFPVLIRARLQVPQPGWSRSWHIDGTGVNGCVAGPRCSELV
jgi:hypothetical protein